MKIFKRFLLALFVILIIAVVYNYPRLNIISGYAAKNMASHIFIAQRTAVSITENDNNFPLIKLADTDIHTKEKSVSASVYGLMDRKAIYRKGLGAVLINDEFDFTKDHLSPTRALLHNNSPFPYGNNGVQDSVFENVDYQLLNQMLDSVFAKSDIRKTRTVLVAYKNHIIGERYADGFNKDTPVLGWSMTKSVWATLYGILEYQNRINVHEYLPFKVHKYPNVSGKDPREVITLNHLLRMQSGLAWDEDYSAISDVTQMLFLDSDMTLAQSETAVIAKPTEVWNYSSGTSNLLSGILRKEFASYQEYLDFPYTQLIDKIGMHSMLIEADMAGNYVGSSYGWANTRDWAKFGLLYLHKGNWNGEQLFAPEWVDYVTRATDKSDGTYGAHFWLNAQGKYPDVPRDLFSANGYQGQYVFIIPSKDLVVVRTGLAEAPYFDINAFLKEILTAIH